MTNVLHQLEIYLSYPFVKYAIVVTVFIAFCSSLLGVTLVLKRFSFIGDGLSHVAFGAVAIATIMNLTNQFLLVAPITILSAVLILRMGQNSGVKGDAALAMVSVGALALGYLFLNIFSSSPNISGDVCSTLFGSTAILTLSKTQVYVSLIMSLILIIIFVLFYHKIFSITFDETFTKATGTKTGFYNTVIAIVTAMVIVLAMNLVGSLLASALIVFPALSAMRIFKSFLSVTICSAVFAVVGALIGLILAILLETPVGATIVAVNIVLFIIFWVLGKIDIF
ncbi:MAG TPA: metal ABC transporter permease [Candidatus Dorea intestinavium]|nr:metal ABC transporter permease [Candidatus Dorea intestinavium]